MDTPKNKKRLIVGTCPEGRALLAKLKIVEGGRLHRAILLKALTEYVENHWPDLLETRSDEKGKAA